MTGVSGISAAGLGAQPPGATRSAPPDLRGAQESFASILGRDAGKSKKTPQQQARDAAEKFVSISLVQPILAQLRENSQAAPPFAPSNGEKQFRALLDAHIAQEVTHAARFPVVDAVARRLLGKVDGRATPGGVTEQ
jgi:Rod binding domain-containing protein